MPEYISRANNPLGMKPAKPTLLEPSRRRHLSFWFAIALLTGCSAVSNNIKYQQSAAVANQLDEHPFVLHHTPAGSYSYYTTSPSQGKVILSVAGVTDRDDQDAILKVLENHRFDTHRDWDEIRVLFYETTVPTPQGTTYVHLLRQEVIQ